MANNKIIIKILERCVYENKDNSFYKIPLN